MLSGASFRADYAKPAYTTVKTDLAINLSKAKTSVIATHFIKPDLSTKENTPLVLNGCCLTLEKVLLDGSIELQEWVDYTLVADSKGNQVLTLLKPPKADFTLTVYNKTLPPAQNKSLEGLFVSGNSIVSHCEAEGYRRIAFSQDRPDDMPLMTTTIHADQTELPVVLSNGPLTARTQSQDSNLTHTSFQDLHKKPTYLFALVAGSLHVLEDTFIAKDGTTTKLQIFVENPKDVPRCRAAMDILKEAMAFYEQKYAYRYGSEYKIVGVKDFNPGAMENTGLNIFALNELVFDPFTTPDQGKPSPVRIRTVVAHELSHLRAGCYVTVQNWFELALKEGLATKLEAEFSSATLGYDITRIRNIQSLLSSQFPEDKGPLAHKVHPQGGVPQNFYTYTTYYKGAELLSMLECWLGETVWETGLNWYFNKHDGQAVTIDDLIRALEEKSSEIPHAKFEQFKRWYEKVGTPEVEIDEKYDANSGTYSVTFTQPRLTNGKAINKPFLIPMKIALLDRNGNDIPLQLAHEPKAQGTTRVLEFSERKQTFTFVNIKEKPTLSWRDFSAPVKITKTPYEPIDRLFLIAHDSNNVNRWLCAQALALETLSKIVKEIAFGKAPSPIDTRYSDTYRAVLKDARLSHQLKAYLLELPSEKEVLNHNPGVDPVIISKAHAFLSQQLANQLRSELNDTYKVLTSTPSSDQYSPILAGARALKNHCLAELLRCKNNNRQAVADAATQYIQARNITERLGALTPLFVVPPPEDENDREYWVKTRAALLDKFYDLYQSEPTVINQLFKLQALSRNPNVITELEILMGIVDVKKEPEASKGNPKFDINNPANVRNTLVTFIDLNPLFHQDNGAGYQFVAKVVMHLDQEVKNSDLAAQILRPMLSSMQNVDASRQEKIRAELQHLKAAALSAPVMELINKGLSAKPASDAGKKQEGVDVVATLRGCAKPGVDATFAVNQLRMLGDFLQLPEHHEQKGEAAEEMRQILATYQGLAKEKLPKAVRKEVKDLSAKLSKKAP